LAGRPLLANNFVRWLNFPLVKNKRWHHKNAVLLGDALHTAHFSIGSGTKLALEDSVALAKCFKAGHDFEATLAEFQEVRKPIVDEYQDAAYSSLLLFENAQELMQLEPIELAYKLMTRSKKIDHDNLKQRDPEFIAAYDKSKMEVRSQKSEVRSQEPEVRSQKSEVRGQEFGVGSSESGVGRQKAEGRRQKAEERKPKTEGRSQKPEARNQEVANEKSRAVGKQSQKSRVKSKKRH
jgi:hypothetical protein